MPKATATDTPPNIFSLIPNWLQQHLAIVIIGAAGAVMWFGALAWLDTRHVQRGEFLMSIHADRELRLLDKIDDADAEIERLELYNRLGSQNNQPARDQVIIQTQNRKAKWERELDLLEQQRPEPDGD